MHILCLLCMKTGSETMLMSLVSEDYLYQATGLHEKTEGLFVDDCG